MKRMYLLIAMLGMSVAAMAQTLTSPDGNLILDFHLSENRIPVYSLTYKGKEVIKESRMGFLVRPDYKFDRNFRIVRTEETSSDTQS